jgi:hypothetical protein
MSDRGPSVRAIILAALVAIGLAIYRVDDRREFYIDPLDVTRRADDTPDCGSLRKPCRDEGYARSLVPSGPMTVMIIMSSEPLGAEYVAKEVSDGGR